LAGRAALAIDNARLYAAAEAEKTEAQAAAAALRSANIELEQFVHIVSLAGRGNLDMQKPASAGTHSKRDQGVNASAA
jgi:hypothetical protein